MTAATFLSTFAEAVANDGGLVLLFVIIFITGVRKVWVFGYTLNDLRAQLTDERVEAMGRINELRAERDSWRQVALGQGRPPQPPAAEGD